MSEEPGKEQDQADLREFRRLEAAEAGDAEPSGGAVEGLAERRKQEPEDPDHEEPDQAVQFHPEMVVDQGKSQHEDEAQQEAEHLLTDGRRSVGIMCHGALQDGKAQNAERDHDQQHRQVEIA